jgi:tRNA threonylcarbamoyl adenosine modification protein YjeE
VDEPATDSLRVPLPTRRSTRRFGARLAGLLKAGDVVFLEGPLGAGKTFLVRSICRALDVPSREPVTSPTFALLNRIESGRTPVLHADLYRLTDASSLDALGLADELDGAVGLIEWGARFADAITSDGVEITITGRDALRQARVASRGARGAAVLGELIRLCGTEEAA